MKKVQKRDGRIVDFDSQKIINAVLAAFKDVDGEITDYAKTKVKQLSELLESKKESDKNKKDFDKQYAMLIEKELREVQKYDKMMRRKRKWKLWFQY